MEVTFKAIEPCEKVRLWSCDPTRVDWEDQSVEEDWDDEDEDLPPPPWTSSTHPHIVWHHISPYHPHQSRHTRVPTMGSSIGQVGLVLFVVLACGTFFIQYTIFKSVHNVPTRSVASDDPDNQLGLGRSNDINWGAVEIDHQVELETADAVVVPSNHNFYISSKNYIPRLNPVQHVEQPHKQGVAEPTAYKVVAELGHRYGVKYIIDIGCGAGKYLAQLSHEFRIIGIDYGINLEKAKKSYPGLTFLDVNLDEGKGCTVTLPEDVLFQSIVISAEVIEHLVDPLYCYMRVLRHLSAYAAAIVVTSPDRDRMASTFHWQHRLSGPPVNKRHVREWTIQEMNRMFKDIGMRVVLSAWVCGRNKKCSSGYSLGKNPFVSQLLVLGNTNVGKVWEDRLVPITTKLTTFVMIHPKTSLSFINRTVDHLIRQGSQVVLIQKKCNVTLLSNPAILASFYISKTSESLQAIKSVMSSEAYNFKYGDWFMVQDAHEIVSIPLIYPLQNYTLRRFLQQVAFEPYGFNAVSITTLCMNSTKTLKSSDRLPFRIHSVASWDNNDGSTIYPRRDTVQDKVRVWRKTYRTPRFFTSGANKTGSVVTDVHFLGRRVYPFHLQSLRFSTQTKIPHVNISLGLSRMYGLEIGIGYTSAIRKNVFQRRLPY